MSVAQHEDTLIYVVGRESGPVKIGISNSVMKRIASLQTGCPFKLRLLAAFSARNREHARDHEARFIRRHDHFRLEGEWFSCDSDYAIDQIATALEAEGNRNA